MGDLIDFSDFPEPTRTSAAKASSTAPHPRPSTTQPQGMQQHGHGFLSREKALSIAAWSGNVSGHGSLRGKMSGNVPEAKFATGSGWKAVGMNGRETGKKVEKRDENKEEKLLGLANGLKDGSTVHGPGKNDENGDGIKKQSDVLAKTEEKQVGPKESTPKQPTPLVKPEPTSDITTPAQNKPTTNPPAAPRKDAIAQNSDDALYRHFAIVDPESRAGRYIAAFHQQVKTHNVEIPVLRGAYEYVRWSDQLLNSIPARCRQIIENGETKCPIDGPDARVIWHALNEFLYGYIYRSLDAGVALATVHPESRSAYRFWEGLYVRYGAAAMEIERRELVAMLARLKITRGERGKEWEVRDIVARLARAGYDLDDEQLRVLFHRGIPEYQRIEVALGTAPLLEREASVEIVQGLVERVYSHLPVEGMDE